MYTGIKYEQGRIVTYYKICPSIARQMWKGVVNLACLAICAANDTTWQQVPSRGPNDSVYPLDVLLEWGSNFSYVLPHLSLSCDTDLDNPLLSYETLFLHQLEQYFVGYQNVACYYSNWIRSAIKTSLNSGFQSETNWGVFWGLLKEDFLDMAAPGVFDIVCAPEEGRFRWVGHNMSLEPIRHGQPTILNYTENRHSRITDALVLHPQHCNSVEWGNSLGCNCYDLHSPEVQSLNAHQVTRVFGRDLKGKAV